MVRFTKIGFPHPDFAARFVGSFEIVCGLLVLVGFGTRAAAVPLLIVIGTAIAAVTTVMATTTSTSFTTPTMARTMPAVDHHDRAADDATTTITPIMIETTIHSGDTARSSSALMRRSLCV